MYIATQTGFFGGVKIREGQEIPIKPDKKFIGPDGKDRRISERWMKKVDGRSKKKEVAEPKNAAGQS